MTQSIDRPGVTLIAGLGYVGRTLAERLVSAGEHVVALRRSPDGTEPCEARAADLTDERALAGALVEPVARIAYLAGPDARSPEAYRRAYVEGLTTLLRVVESRGDPLERLVFVSSTAVYGDRDGAEVDEDSEPAPADATARVLVEAESVAHAARCRSSVVRLAGIYGPGRTRLIREVREGRARLDAGPSPTNRIHRDDAAGLVHALLDHADPPPVVVGVDDDPADRASVLAFLAERLGVPVPSVDPSRPRPRGNKRCRSTRREALGYELAYPTYREGYASLLASEPDAS